MIIMTWMCSTPTTSPQRDVPIHIVAHQEIKPTAWRFVPNLKRLVQKGRNCIFIICLRSKWKLNILCRYFIVSVKISFTTTNLFYSQFPFSFSRGKTAGAWIWAFTFDNWRREGRLGLYFHSTYTPS